MLKLTLASFYRILATSKAQDWSLNIDHCMKFSQQSYAVGPLIVQG